MERPICYQQLFVTIKVCRLMSCDFMTKLFKWAGVRPNHSSENELIHAWTAGFVNIWKIWIFRYIATWYIVIVVNVMVWSTNPILKRSPLRVLRPACACGNEFHRLHIWFIWKIMDFCSFAGLSRVAELHATQLLSTPLRCLINSRYLLEEISLPSTGLWTCGQHSMFDCSQNV